MATLDETWAALVDARETFRVAERAYRDAKTNERRAYEAYCFAMDAAFPGEGCADGLKREG